MMRVPLTARAVPTLMDATELELNARFPVTVATAPVFRNNFPVAPGKIMIIPAGLKPLVFTFKTPSLVSVPKFAASMGRL